MISTLLMIKNRFIINNTGVVLLLLLGVIGATSTVFSTAHAQTPTLGKPIFVEKGEDTTHRQIGPNITLYTFTANGTMNGNIEYHKTGKYVSVSKGNNQTFDQGHGVLTTKDGETANYTFVEVGNGAGWQGASVYNTNSTGKLSILDNVVVIYKIGKSEGANYVDKQWLWK